MSSVVSTNRNRPSYSPAMGRKLEPKPIAVFTFALGTPPSNLASEYLSFIHRTFITHIKCPKPSRKTAAALHCTAQHLYRYCTVQCTSPCPALETTITAVRVLGIVRLPPGCAGPPRPRAMAPGHRLRSLLKRTAPGGHIVRSVLDVQSARSARSRCVVYLCTFVCRRHTQASSPLSQRPMPSFLVRVHARITLACVHVACARLGRSSLFVFFFLLD